MNFIEYYARWLKVNMAMLVRYVVRKYPLTTFISLGFIIVSVYFTLDQFTWGKQALNFIIALFSSEIIAYRLYKQGYEFWQIASCFIVADMIAIIIDILLVNGLLRWRWSTSIINTVAHNLRVLKGEIKKIFGQTNSFSQIDRMKNHLNSFRKKPSKANLFTIYCLGLLPRIPPLPGGVSIGVFILRYNKYGYFGWVMLILGMITRHLVVLGSIYEFSYFF